MYTGCLQQAIRELITNAACQAVNVRLYIIAVKAHDNNRLTLESRVLAKLVRNIGYQLGIYPVLQWRRTALAEVQRPLTATGCQQYGQ
jgi:hypothetical protein